jgi:hypothetical protein
MWSVMKGSLYWGGERVPVRRSVVDAVMGRTGGPVSEKAAHRMIRRERALSLAGLCETLARSREAR